MADTAAPDFQRLFEALPQQYIVVDPRFRVVAATDSFLAATLKDRTILGKDILEVFPDNPDDPAADGTAVLRGSLERVLATKEIDVLKPQRYDMERADGSFEVRYWKPLNAPVLDDRGEILYIIHGAEDVTAQMI